MQCFKSEGVDLILNIFPSQYYKHQTHSDFLIGNVGFEMSINKAQHFMSPLVSSVFSHTFRFPESLSLSGCFIFDELQYRLNTENAGARLGQP